MGRFPFIWLGGATRLGRGSDGAGGLQAIDDVLIVSMVVAALKRERTNLL